MSNIISLSGLFLVIYQVSCRAPIMDDTDLYQVYHKKGTPVTSTRATVLVFATPASSAVAFRRDCSVRKREGKVFGNLKGRRAQLVALAGPKR